MFKYIVLFGVLLIACQAEITEQQKEALRNHHRECLAISGVDEELVTKARNGEFTDDEKLKEHLLCVSKRIGFQNEAGEIQKDVLKEKVNAALNDEKKTEDLINKCAIQKDTPQNTAFETVKCYYDTTHIL